MIVSESFLHAVIINQYFSVWYAVVILPVPMWLLFSLKSCSSEIAPP